MQELSFALLGKMTRQSVPFVSFVASKYFVHKFGIPAVVTPAKFWHEYSISVPSVTMQIKNKTAAFRLTMTQHDAGVLIKNFGLLREFY